MNYTRNSSNYEVIRVIVLMHMWPVDRSVPLFENIDSLVCHSPQPQPQAQPQAQTQSVSQTQSITVEINFRLSLSCGTTLYKILKSTLLDYNLLIKVFTYIPSPPSPYTLHDTPYTLHSQIPTTIHSLKLSDCF